MRADSNDCSDAELSRAAGADAAAFLYERHALRVCPGSRRRLAATDSNGNWVTDFSGNTATAGFTVTVKRRR